MEWLKLSYGSSSKYFRSFACLSCQSIRCASAASSGQAFLDQLYFLFDPLLPVCPRRQLLIRVACSITCMDHNQPRALAKLLLSRYQIALPSILVSVTLRSLTSRSFYGFSISDR